MEQIKNNIELLSRTMAATIIDMHTLQSDAIAINLDLRECIRRDGQYPAPEMFELVMLLDGFLKRFGEYNAFGDIRELRPGN
jgi:hypothetical protein